MKPNTKLRDRIFEMIKNQREANDPPEVNLTYQRLIDLGHSDFVTMQLIGQCLSVELFNIMKFKKKFDLPRYIKNLKALPEEPFD